MQQFSDFIDFCATQFGSTSICKDCPYGECIHDYPSLIGCDCYPCLSKIHRYANNKWKYQCHRIVYNYVLKHGHRYASELDKIISLLLGSEQFPNELNVYSIGCGPCTELFGVFNQFQDRRVHFKGFDLNPIWQPLNDFERTLFSDRDIQFYNENFFDFVAGCDEHIDLLIINYMLSDMARYESGAVCSSFIDQLVALCEAGIITYIVINDVYLTYNSRTGYALMEEFARKLQANKSINERLGRGRFVEPNQFQSPYGKIYQNNLTFPIVEQSVRPFGSMSNCGSIFLLVHIQKNSNDTERKQTN